MGHQRAPFATVVFFTVCHTRFHNWAGGLTHFVLWRWSWRMHARPFVKEVVVANAVQFGLKGVVDGGELHELLLADVQTVLRRIVLALYIFELVAEEEHRCLQVVYAFTLASHQQALARRTVGRGQLIAERRKRSRTVRSRWHFR